MRGDNSGRRQQPWRASNSANLYKFSAFGLFFHLGDAEVANGRVQPQPAFYASEGKGRIIVAFDRYVAGNNQLGIVVGGVASGSVIVTSVSPRFILQSGGSALTAASGSPTVSLGLTSGGAELIPSTPIASIATIASPVDGTRAKEVTPSGSLDATFFLNVKDGVIASNARAALVIDFTYTIGI